jgi:hypothetical protein
MGKVCQIPLQLAWASTAHKLQGSTIPQGKDLVVHGHRKLPPHMLYVMMSRASSIENLFLDKSVNLDRLVCKSQCRQLAENYKLEQRSLKNASQVTCSIVLLNVRSLKKHLEDVTSDLVMQAAECICLTETWMNNESTEVPDLFDMTKYQSSYGRGKGCAMYINKTKKSELIGKFSVEHYQLLSVAFDGKYQIILVYVSQGQKNNPEIIDCLNLLWKSNYQQIVLGDFNFDANEESTIKNFLESRGLTQQVDEPTHLEGRIIDHCYVSSNLTEFKFELFSPYYTDHCGLKITL